jgi:glycosyltransferase involved in cell wall biosynthesis
LAPTITIDYTPAVEQTGGIGRYVRELVGALTEQPVTHFDYKLFVAGTKSSQLPSPLAPHVHWKPTPITPRWFARIWHRLRAPIPIEAFVGRTALYHATDFVLLPTLPKTRTLLTVHDLSFVRVPDAASPSLKAYLDTVVPRSVKRADHILADSQATKHDLIAVYGTAPEKITVLLSGVEKRFKRVTDNHSLLTTRSKYYLGQRPYILSLGTVQPRKNYERLVQSLHRLRSTGHDVDLVIVGGRGWLENPLYETIRQLKLEDHVHITGFADEADLPALYSGAVCFALPSLYEGFGIPVLEAMACGVPVVTSTISSLPEVAGDAALMIDPYNVEELTEALRRLIIDDSLQNHLIQRGYQQAAAFTWERAAAQLLQVYQQLMS